MFHSGENIDTSSFKNIKKVKSEKELAVFLETFDLCYQKNDPQNPYGELGNYLKVTESVWRLHNKTGRLEYFIMFDDDKPVSVATLTNFAGIGYISNVGSKLACRGRGFGKTISHYCVYKSSKNGNNCHCLATEEGHYPYDFYQRIGFRVEFTAPGFVRK